MTRVQFHSGWFTNSAYIQGEQVPAGQVWLIQLAGLCSNDPALVGAELQVEEPVLSQNNVMHWAMPAPTTAATAGTPKVELLRSLVLVEGQRIAGRTTAPLADLALLYSGWSFPATLLPQLLGVNAAPDFSGVITAAQGFVQALQAVP